MTITIDLPTDVLSRLAEKATREGRDVTGLMQQLAAREAGIGDTQSLADWDMLLDSFDEGDPGDHRDTVETLVRSLNEDRPGQRRVFGEGDNP